MQSIKWFFILSIGIFGSCKTDVNKQIQTLDLLTESSLAPNLFRSPSGLLYMSWIEIVNDSLYSLQYSLLEEDSWSLPREIASGTDWFVNWADIPAIVTYDDKHIAAHWLQMSGAGTYDYSIRITLSKDSGKTWSESITPHQQEVPAEHGFVSMAPVDKTHFQIIWLDGRNTKLAAVESKGHDHGGGEMSLRSAIMDFEGNTTSEHEIDKRVCECCQVDMIISRNVPIVIYRDRSAAEVRDISISRYDKEQWTEPIKVHNDEWQIFGCPVNGPALAKSKKGIAVIWFTESSDAGPQVLMAISEDNGKNFNSPYRLNSGESSGRVDIIPWETGFVASWMERKDSTNYLMMGYLNDGMLDHIKKVMPLNATRRGGFPIIEPSDGGIVIAFTEVNEEKTVVRSKKIIFERL